jgi:cytochrome c peroxidase
LFGLILLLGMAIAADLSPKEQLGKSIYFDEDLSLNFNQSCAACHDPAAGWTGPSSLVNETTVVYPGSFPDRFGDRKPPAASYATLSPILHFAEEGEDILFIGGNFWDGRATGEKLGNPAADQAQGPFLIPVAQALPDSACVVYRVCTAAYPVSFEEVFGPCDISWPADVETVCMTEGGTVALSDEDRAKSDSAYDSIALAIAAFEDSAEVNAFTSKYDYFLAGLVDLTKEEKKGLNMFKSKGKCDFCHVLDPGPGDTPPLLTDFTYDNLGIPINRDNPAFVANPDFRDPGLGGFLETRPEYAEFAEENMGKHKVPSLRNVDKRPYEGFVKTYGHNGYFKSLLGIVHFYNTRDAKNRCEDPLATEAEALAQKCWPAPEIMENVNTDELGDLKLTDDQEKAIVAFLKTLSDGYVLPE